MIILQKFLQLNQAPDRLVVPYFHSRCACLRNQTRPQIDWWFHTSILAALAFAIKAGGTFSAKKFKPINSTTFVLFDKYYLIVDQLGLKDSSRDFQLNCVIIFFTYIYYFMHGSKDWCDRESEKILTFKVHVNQAWIGPAVLPHCGCYALKHRIQWISGSVSSRWF
jgi:hypothetical protein